VSPSRSSTPILVRTRIGGTSTVTAGLFPISTPIRIRMTIARVRSYDAGMA
jgi:hypothetical protein